MRLAEDLFIISYDGNRIQPEEMLAAVEKSGFQGRIVPVPEDSNGSAGGKRYALDRLPASLRQHFAKAKEQGKYVLLAFHGPG